MSLTDLTLTELAAALARKQTSAREITDAFLDRIEKADSTLHAFTEVYAADARAIADGADRTRSADLPHGKLLGLPTAIKDLCDIKDRVGTTGSRMWAERRATETSATVERLLAAGMVPLGKLHMVEFAFGGWGTNPLMGAPRNPWDLAVHRCAGGSSSGTGVAVAARLAPAGIGSDTGGSVRIPSAFNGLIGLKVTFGRISLHGTGLLSWTLDSIGPMGRSVEDCALLLQTLAGPDVRDPATLHQPADDFVAAVGRPVKGMRVALPDADQLPAFMHAGVVAAWQQAARTFEQLGAVVETVRLPDWYFDLSVPAGTIIASEAFSLHRGWIEDERQPIGPVVRQRVLNAKHFPPAAYAETLRDMHQRRRIFAQWLHPFDAVLLPTVAIPAISLTEIEEMSPIPGYLTRPANYLGLCGLAMPSGFVDGLPVSIQIVGKPYAEATVLALGKAFQDATGFNSRKPDLAALGL
ncbi:amidase [Vineibacter terrae]|uniref:amidase n=1 Tax=Vineibacter terrae TaxID=2586908 RepID=UPI001C49ACD9|nr:amidase [Vineibacter terrae]